MTRLTDRQQEVLDYLETRLRQSGLMPSTRELQQHFGFASQTAAVNHLRALERKGAIKRLAGKARAVRLAARPGRARGVRGGGGHYDGSGGVALGATSHGGQLPATDGTLPPAPSSSRYGGERVAHIPIFGQIPAGLSAPTEGVAERGTEEDEGSVSIDLKALGVPQRGRTFALRVRGDSMVGAHLVDGDLVIMEAREPRRGDIVAALIDGETTLKRFECDERGRPLLRPENPRYPTLRPARDLAIQGVMIAMVRPGAS